MALSVIAGVTILVLIIQGYRFNRYDGRIEQGGLVQFDSRPSGASVKLDDIQLANRTASKLTVSAGTHQVTMSRDGYLPWTKTVSVKAGSVLWLNYVRLFPASPKVSAIASYDGYAGALISPDRKLAAIVSVPTQPVLYIVSLNDDKPQTRKVEITDEALTAADDAASVAFSLVSWGEDGQYVIMKRTYDGKTEYLSVDTTNGAARNITRLLGVSALRLEYVLGDRNSLYILTESHELRRGDIGAVTMSGPLLSNLADFAQADRSTVTYETRPAADGSRSVGYLTNGATRPRTVRTVKDDGSASFKFRMGTYYGDDYLVVAYGDTTTVYTADVPSSDAASALSWTRVGWMATAGGVSRIGFSPHTQRFVYAQMKDAAVTYDLETDVIGKTAFQGELSRSIDWIDNFHIGSTAANAAYFYDFDGTNGRAVAAGVSDAPMTISENGKYLYYFAPDSAKTVLKRIQLVS